MDSIINTLNILLNKFNKKNVTVIVLLFLLISVYSLRANALNLGSNYASDLESQITNIPNDQLSNTSFITNVPVSVYTIEGEGKSIKITYVTLVNLISGEFIVDLSDYEEFNSVRTRNFFLPGQYKVYVTIVDSVLVMEFERTVGEYNKR